MSGALLVCALPVVLAAGLTDIHESRFNGPEGYAYFVGAGTEKTGDLPPSVGENPTRRFETDVYATNFQGPVLVQHEGLRAQWEWTADGALEVSERSYPVPMARRCEPQAASLPDVHMQVEEHDEPPWRSDPVGAFAFELSACADVLAGGATSGWSPRRRAEGEPYHGDRGPSSIAWVDYVVWCTATEPR